MLNTYGICPAMWAGLPLRAGGRKTIATSRTNARKDMRAVQRLTIVIVSAALVCVAPAYAQAPAGDASSSRPITLVVPIAAGGGMDTLGRALAERLQERLKQPVVVENRIGAGGVVGVD